MKLILAIMASDDANKTQKALMEENFFSTRLSTSGGFLRAKNVTFMIGVHDECVSKVFEIIEINSKRRKKTIPNTIANEFSSFNSLPSEVVVGGATVFVLDVEKFTKI